MGPMGARPGVVGRVGPCIAVAALLTGAPCGPGGPEPLAAQSTEQSAQVTAQPLRWQVDGASVTFEIHNFGLPVRGTFGSLDADLSFDPERPETGSLAATVDPATIRTGIEMRDRHLRGRDYFHVEKYGAIELRSVRIQRSGVGYSGTFRLRIRDVEREVEIPFQFEALDSTARVSGSLTLDRLDYGIGRPSPILADEVTVAVVLRLRRDR